jgi:hypothetical protein
MYALYTQDRHRLPRIAVMLNFLSEIFGAVSWRTAKVKSTRKPKPARRRRTAHALIQKGARAKT